MTRRFVAVLLVLAAWVAGTVAGSLGGSPAAASSPGIVIGKAHAEYTPSLTGSKPIVILAVGSGARPGEDVLHSLSDSLHLIFLNPDQHAGTLVGIPRDSWVDIPGHGSNKINSALAVGGPDLMVQTIEARFGVHIDYWAITTFWGFKGMLDQIGGLTVNVPFRMYDPSYSGADLQAGVQRLTGAQALAMARDRHSLLAGDFGRQENGGRLILSALTQFQKEFDADPGSAFSWIGAGMTRINTSLTVDDVILLAYTATAQPVGKIRNIVLPGSSQTIGGLSAVALNATAVSQIFKDVTPDGIMSKKNVPPSPTAGQPR
ncbi:MAG: LCP family protein [Actinomycetota bacterium]|nr:LCP family protein [Actinomycetota bacterium]